MPKIISCLLDGKPITIAEALTLRHDVKVRGVEPPLFRCDGCAHSVEPHDEGTTGNREHFEHVEKNKYCPYLKIR